MAQMSMNKVIHGAFRRDLDRFVGALTSFTAGDSARAHQLGRAWANFDLQLTDHHEGEHEIAWPALESVGVTRETIAQMDAEHETMAAALAQARTAMSSLESTAGQGEAEAALSALMRLRDVTVEHLDHEEREIEPIYIANADGPEMKEMGKKFARTGPAKAGVFFTWILDGATAEEKQALTSSVPGPVLKILTTLFGRSYRKDVAPVWSS
ncbi:hemerythrin domain-containing protein [Marmoricola sp. URHB0036]|uniref:hemerythrin domain-containing protein n=1 Tax=Marmoricola sp. URHB0036 TaxID=1298863 RepID=UPI0004212834|nr:hemerythrin domain-containing protein [Marmoricola sp. URHB0036]